MAPFLGMQPAVELLSLSAPLLFSSWAGKVLDEGPRGLDHFALACSCTPCTCTTVSSCSLRMPSRGTTASSASSGGLMLLSSSIADANSSREPWSSLTRSKRSAGSAPGSRPFRRSSSTCDSTSATSCSPSSCGSRPSSSRPACARARSCRRRPRRRSSSSSSSSRPARARDPRRDQRRALATPCASSAPCGPQCRRRRRAHAGGSHEHVRCARGAALRAN